MPPTISYPPVTFGPDGKIYPLLTNGHHLDLPAGTTLNGASIDTGSVATWGDIIGTLSAQTDLAAALALKAPLVSPTFTTPTLGAASATSLALAAGSVSVPSLHFGSMASNYGFYSRDATTVAFSAAGTDVFEIATGNVQMANATFVGWSSTNPASLGVDTNISRNAAGVVQFGTGASKNALGGWLATNGTITSSLTITGATVTGRIGNANLPLGAQLYDNAGTPVLSADFGARVLKGPTGNISMAWDDADYLEFPLGISTNYITASDTSDSIYVDLRSLHDTSGVTAIDWNTRHLLSTDGSSVLVDWANPSALSLMDSTVAIDDAGNLSVAGIFIGDGSGITNIYGLTLAANQSVRRNAGNTAYEVFQAQPYSGGTLSIASGKTLTASNTLTLSGTDGSTLAIGTGGTLGTNAYTSTAYAPIASPTFTGTVTTPNLSLSSGTLNILGNFSSSAWTTSGVRIKGFSAIHTDTTSTGTVALAYTDKFVGSTVAASNTGVTFTDYISSYFSEPVAGTNVTLTNKYALGADSLKVGTSNAFKVTSAGNVTIAGTLTLPSASIADAALSANVPLLNAASNAFTGNLILSNNKEIDFKDTGGTARTILYFDGSNTLFLQNNALGSPHSVQLGAGGGALSYDGSNWSTAGNLTVSVNGAASTPAEKLTGTWFTGGSATTTKPQLLIEPAGTTTTGWSTSGTGLGVNAASGFAGRLASFQVAGAEQIGLNNDGTFMADASALRVTSIYTTQAGALAQTASLRTARLGTTSNEGVLNLSSGGSVGFSSNSGGSADANSNIDLRLARNAAGVAEINNGTAGTYRDLKFRNINLTGGVVADSGGIKHSRVTTGSISGASTALVTVTWGTAFADANYTVQASVQDSTTSSLSLSVVHVESVSASSVTVRVLNNAATPLTGTLHCLAIHD